MAHVDQWIADRGSLFWGFVRLLLCLLFFLAVVLLLTNASWNRWESRLALRPFLWVFNPAALKRLESVWIEQPHSVATAFKLPSSWYLRYACSVSISALGLGPKGSGICMTIKSTNLKSSTERQSGIVLGSLGLMHSSTSLADNNLLWEDPTTQASKMSLRYRYFVTLIAG